MEPDLTSAVVVAQIAWATCRLRSISSVQRWQCLRCARFWCSVLVGYWLGIALILASTANFGYWLGTVLFLSSTAIWLLFWALC